ncbi:hypothetical protein D3C76_1066100 [compost metagenome]
MQVQITKVSRNTLNAWTTPCAPGCFTAATAATLGALPRPASLANTPRFTPMTMALPSRPAKAGSRPKALLKMVSSIAGTCSIWVPITYRVTPM